MTTETRILAIVHCIDPPSFLIRAARAQATDTAQLGTVVVSASKVPKPASSLTQPVTVLSGRRSSRAGELAESDRCVARGSRRYARAERLVRRTDLALSSRWGEPVHQGADRRSAGERCRGLLSTSVTSPPTTSIALRSCADRRASSTALTPSSGIVQIFTSEGAPATRAHLCRGARRNVPARSISSPTRPARHRWEDSLSELPSTRLMAFFHSTTSIETAR